MVTPDEARATLAKEATRRAPIGPEERNEESPEPEQNQDQDEDEDGDGNATAVEEDGTHTVRDQIHHVYLISSST